MLFRSTGADAVELIGFERKRYVGAQIGGYNPAGVRVSDSTHTRNIEFLFIAGPRDRVAAGLAAITQRQLSNAST